MMVLLSFLTYSFELFLVNLLDLVVSDGLKPVYRAFIPHQVLDIYVFFNLWNLLKKVRAVLFDDKDIEARDLL